VALDRFHAVNVPAGAHTVEWRYRPRSVLLGGMLSTSTALIGLIALGAWRLRKRFVDQGATRRETSA
jgi:hypothetical protein